MKMVGIRGATVAEANTPEAILAATRDLLLSLQEANPDLEPDNIASVLFTVTEDLTGVYPAQAARQLGWHHVPLMCAREIPVPGSLSRCVRILIHWNTELSQDRIHHVYLKDAHYLRPELT